MESIHIDTGKQYGAFKPLNATNGGPWHRRHANDQSRSNLDDYRALRIPFARNHDSNANGIYGGPYAHDITAVFPRFEADPADPASYDFACTDEAILVALEAGTKTYYRLGQTIEHQIKKHGTLPPADFHKWAAICEHVIRHYTEGWADGYHFDMPYWEIWNEPDLDPDDSANKRCWGGTQAQFFDFYEIVARHLKRCFPQLKIGGPASCGNERWTEEFLRCMKERSVPLDFFSWHIYTTSPMDIYQKSVRIKAMLCKYGYEHAESILNEWNYIGSWWAGYVDSLKAIHGMKGAAFTMATISLAQQSTIDMLMYYDTRPSVFCGVFDFYTYEKLKGYYPLYWYGMFYDMRAELRADSLPKDVYLLSGVDENGKTLTVVTYYTNEADMPVKELELDFGRDGVYEAYRLDAHCNGEKTAETSNLRFTMLPNSCLLLREV